MTTMSRYNARYWRATAEKDRDTTLQLAAYRGEQMDTPGLSLAVFTKGNNSPVFKERLNANWIAAFRVLWDEVIRGGKGSSRTMVSTDWDRENKKVVKKGAITIGIDEQDVAYFGIQANGITKKFPLMPPFNPDLSSLDLPSPTMHRICVSPFLEGMEQYSTAVAIAGYTPAKRDGNNGGGNRGGGGGGGYRGSGGGQSHSQGVESEIPF